MGRPNKKRIAGLLEEWHALGKKMEAIERKRDRALEPMRARFETDSAPIVEAALAKLMPIEQDMTDIETEIESALLAGVLPDGTVQVAHVATDHAIAEVLTRKQRTIAPKDFFAAVPGSKRDKSFWGCVRVMVEKAEKFLGSAVDELATDKVTHTVSVRGKSRDEG